MKYKLTKKAWQEAGKKAGWIKTAAIGIEDMPGDDSQKYRQDTNLEDTVATEDSAIKFLLSNDPFDTAAFLGLKPVELINRVQKNKDEVFSSAPLDLKEKINNFNVGNYEDALRIVNALMSESSPEAATEPFLRLLGFAPGTNEIVQRIRTFGPFVIQGPTEMETALKPMPAKEKSRIKDDILDQFSRGEIQEDEVKRLMNEFAKYELQLVKTAQGQRFKWVRKEG